MTALIPTYDFRGHTVRRLTYRDQLAFIGREIGSALGYEDDGKRFVSQVTGPWSTEIREDVHWYRVRGADLREIKASLRLGAGTAPTRGAAAPSGDAALDAGPEPSQAAALDAGAEPGGPAPAPSQDPLLRTPELVLLTEEGLTLALLQSRRPIAVQFRLWLASEVVPQIARTGKYDPAPAHLRLPRPSPEIAALKRVVDHAILSGRLDVAAEMLVVYRKLAAAPGVPLLSPPSRLRASNRLLTRLIQRRALKGGPRLAVLFQQPAWRPSEKAVLGLLLELGAAERRVELSYVDVAERIDLSRPSVIGAINVLKKAGVVAGGGGRRGRDPVPNGYVVDPDALAAWNDKERPDTWSEAEKGPPR